jgi:hypothetical protein
MYVYKKMYMIYTRKHLHIHQRISSYAPQPRRALGVERYTCVRWGMAVAYGRYKFVTVSIPKRLRNGRFNSETAVWRFQK